MLQIYRKVQKKNKPCNQSDERLEGLELLELREIRSGARPFEI